MCEFYINTLSISLHSHTSTLHTHCEKEKKLKEKKVHMYVFLHIIIIIFILSQHFPYNAYITNSLAVQWYNLYATLSCCEWWWWWYWERGENTYKSYVTDYTLPTTTTTIPPNPVQKRHHAISSNPLIHNSTSSLRKIEVCLGTFICRVECLYTDGYVNLTNFME